MVNGNRAISISLVTLATIAVFYVLVAGQAFLVPLAVSVMVWYVINALSRTFAKILPGVEKTNWLTTLVSLISIGLFLTFAVDMLQSNIAGVAKAAPSYKANFDILVTKAVERFPSLEVINFSKLSQGLSLIHI